MHEPRLSCLSLVLTRQLYTLTAQTLASILLVLLAHQVFAQTNDDNETDSPWSDDKGIIVIIKDPYAELHTHAGRGYPIFHVVEKNEKLRVFKRRVGWYKVETEEGKIGWIARKQLANTLDSQGLPLSFANKGWREHDKNRIEVGLLGGSFDSVKSFTAYLGYRFTENISTELTFTQAFGDFSNNKLLSANIVHRPFPTYRLSPFFLLGSGIIQTDPATILAQSEDREDSLVTVGGGFFFHPSNKLVLRVEYNHHSILTSRERNEEVEQWKAGFSVLF